MGAGYGCGCGVNQAPPVVAPVASPFTSTGAILVLFILLVIISRAWLY